MAWWSLLTPKTTEKAVDTVAEAVTGVIDGMDKMFFTDEERSEASQQITQTWLKAIDATASESTSRSMTRRFLAVMVLGVFLALLVGGAVLFKVDPEWSEYILRCAGQLSSLVLSISIFYFGYYGVNSVVKTLKK